MAEKVPPPPTTSPEVSTAPLTPSTSSSPEVAADDEVVHDLSLLTARLQISDTGAGSGAGRGEGSGEGTGEPHRAASVWTCGEYLQHHLPTEQAKVTKAEMESVHLLGLPLDDLGMMKLEWAIPDGHLLQLKSRHITACKGLIPYCDQNASSWATSGHKNSLGVSSDLERDAKVGTHRNQTDDRSSNTVARSRATDSFPLAARYPAFAQFHNVLCSEEALTIGLLEAAGHVCVAAAASYAFETVHGGGRREKKGITRVQRAQKRNPDARIGVARTQALKGPLQTMIDLIARGLEVACPTALSE